VVSIWIDIGLLMVGGGVILVVYSLRLISMLSMFLFMLVLRNEMS